MKAHLYSHLGGAEKLPSAERKEVVQAIERCDVTIARGRGAEIRDSMLRTLTAFGWSGKVQIDVNSKISIASQKNLTAIGIQTAGNMSRMYADLLKLQKLYIDNIISVGAIILPTAYAARILGDNLANSDRLESELEIFSKVITVPIAVISFE
jgi:hypothetical protein